MRLLIAMTSVLFVTGLTSSGVLAQEGRLEVVEIYSPALEDNLIGDPATREMRVYLPPSYDSGQRRYPVIFVLHGFTQNSTTFARVKGNDDLVASGQMPESIVVYVDGYNRFGGSKYLSSQTIGDYETYIARDIVAFVDSAYRTIPHRENRAIYGFSMGAHGALHLAFTYPEVWSIAVGSAGPYDLGTSSVRNTVANTMVAALAHDWDSYAALLERFTKEATFVLSWAAATIPNPDNPPFFVDLPFVEVDGTIQEPTPGAWERAWDGVAEHSVIHDVDGYLASPGRLRFIGFIHGRNDAQANVEAARELDRKLNDLDVEHTYLEHDGGHVANVDQAFVLISAHLHTLPPEAPTVASVDRDSWVAIAGQPRRLDLRVRLAAPLETMGPAARLMLDVSALGEKGASIALRHVADAEYVGSASITPEQYGRFFLPLVLDTGGGDAYVAHTLQVDVFPADDLVVLNGGLASGWQPDVTRETVVLNAETELVFEGSPVTAFQVVPDGSRWSVELLPDVAVDPVGYSSLQFAFHPGDAVVPSRPRFVIVLEREGVDLLEQVDLDRKDWQVVELPLVEFEVEEAIQKIELWGNLEGTFHLADFRLVALKPPLETAVLETRQYSRPDAFVLDPNYPNPFNSGTVIRFALARPQQVELAIYNQVGQQVTTLVSGHRLPGTYTVSWDGSDDYGRSLASGVYLYRLQTEGGQQVKTRRLVLVR